MRVFFASMTIVATGFCASLCAEAVGEQPPRPVELGEWSFPCETATHWILGNSAVAFAISKRTGCVEGGWNVRTRSRYLDRLQSMYSVESKTFAKELRGDKDEVVQVIAAGPTRVKVRCRNNELPPLRIEKDYVVNAGDNKLIRTLTLLNEGQASDWYATVSSRTWLRPAFRNVGYYMGAGYVGPLIPAPHAAKPQRVSRYRISPKGMLLVNPRVGYVLAHYRYKVNGHFLFPWVSKYVEKPNALYYTPTGWQFALATIPLRPARPVSFEGHVMILRGAQDEFLRKAYPQLPEVAARLRQLTPRPKWRENIKFYAGMGCDEHIVPNVQRLVELTDDGSILVLINPLGAWTDYPSRGVMTGPWGGKITGEYVKQLVAKLHALSPRVKVCIYTWLSSATWSARPYLQHPDWFRPRNKAGNFVNLFPGVAANYATLINKKPCRDFLLHQYADHFRDWKVDAIYLDGAKTTNLIDWQKNTLTQDADWEDFWLDMRKVCRAAGPDKALFFNGRANLYADISFIEARSEMREANWCDYAGLMTCTKSFVSNDPGFVIIPLYWVSRLARAYVNHFLPLGFTPAIGHGSLEGVNKLPFITAAYELRPMQQADAGLDPNWQADPKTKLESYSMRKGDTILLGLINHYGKPSTLTLSVDPKKCEFDRDRSVFVWEFALADPEIFHGRTTEHEVRRVYQKTRWFLDRTTSVRFDLAKVDKRGRVTVRTTFSDPTLKLIALTQTPAVVWSVDGMPCHFDLPAVRGVRIEGRVPGDGKVICEAGECEVGLLVQGPSGAAEVRVDGVETAHETVTLGDAWFAKVRFTKGTHKVRWRSAPPSSLLDHIALACPKSVEPGQALHLTLRARRPVVLAGLLNRRPVLCLPVNPTQKQITLPIPKALDGGELELVAFGRVNSARAKVMVKNTPYAPKLKASIPRAAPPKRRIWRVGKTVRGVEILRAATSTYYSALGSPPVATCSPEELSFEVGSADWFTSFLGQGFAGIEAEGMRVVTLDVRNTFYGAFNLRATRYHLHPYKKSTRPFAGIMVDYHTPKGYVKRVALSLGLADTRRRTPQPDWGRNRPPDQFVELCKMIDETNYAQITVDLARYAPRDWDGRVWFTPGVDWVAPDRRLMITILKNAQRAEGDVVVGTDLAELRAWFKKPRRVEVPKATFVPDIDGVMDEEAWREAAQISKFVLVNEAGLPNVWTRVRLFYDADSLYVGVQCQEPDRIPTTDSDSIWWRDEVEFWFDVDGNPKTTHQLIVDARGNSLSRSPRGSWNPRATCAAQCRKGVWTVEAAIPFAALGRQPKPGDAWRFNIARFRPESHRSPRALITWSVLHGSFASATEFGTLVFVGTVAK